MRHVLGLEETLEYIRLHHLFLVYTDEQRIDLWTCGRKMPQPLRRAIFVYREQLLDMMQSGRWEVCPNPKLHKKYSRCAVTCAVCARIDAA